MPAYEVTWFQANEACRASGKRLPDDAEWLAAAEGTPDPPTTEMGDGREGRCLTNVVPRRMSGGRGAATGVIGCESVWGVQDMIGNVREWTNEWAADPGLAGAVPTRASRTAWPAEYRGDESVASDSNPWTGGVYGTGLPAATIRGGSYESGTTAGTFAYSLGFAPSGTNDDVGFRCVIPR